MTTFIRHQQQIVRICHLLASKDYVSGMDGNVSVRLSSDRFLATPAMIHKGFITEDDLVIVNGAGELVDGPPGRRPTSEIRMHLAAYQRPEVAAVVHAHPPTAIAFTLAGETLARCVLPEVVLTLGAIPTSRYHTTGSAELAEEVGGWLQYYDALLLDRHGVICVGRDLIDAFGRVEKVEHTALITLRSRLLGRVRELDSGEVGRLRQLGTGYTTAGHPPPICEGCDGCAVQVPWQAEPSFALGRGPRMGKGSELQPSRSESLAPLFRTIDQKTAGVPTGGGPVSASVNPDKASEISMPALEKLVADEVLRKLNSPRPVAT